MKSINSSMGDGEIEHTSGWIFKCLKFGQSCFKILNLSLSIFKFSKSIDTYSKN